MRIFLSCHSPDAALALALKQALQTSYADAEISFAPQSQRVGNFFVPQICTSLGEPDGVLLMLGESKCCRKLLEAFETLDCHEIDDDFPLVRVIAADIAQRRIKSRKSVRGLNIAPNAALIGKSRLGAGSSENGSDTRGDRQSAQKSHLHTTPKIHGRTAWHI